MSWDFERFNWSDYLTADGDATDIPGTVIRLRDADDEDSAERLYWKIDNVVILQGTLYPAALPTVPCVIDAVQQATDASRQRLLEILAQIGLASLREDGHPDGIFRISCLREVARGAPLYFHLIESKNVDEMINCIDLVSISAIFDKSLNSRAIWNLRRIAKFSGDDGIRDLVESWIYDMSAHRMD